MILAIGSNQIQIHPCARARCVAVPPLHPSASIDVVLLTGDAFLSMHLLYYKNVAVCTWIVTIPPPSLRPPYV